MRGRPPPSRPRLKNGGSRSRCRIWRPASSSDSEWTVGGARRANRGEGGACQERVWAVVMLLAAVGCRLAPEPRRPGRAADAITRSGVWRPSASGRGVSVDGGLPSAPLLPPCVKKDGQLGQTLFSIALCRRCGRAAETVRPSERQKGCVGHGAPWEWRRRAAVVGASTPWRRCSVS